MRNTESRMHDEKEGRWRGAARMRYTGLQRPGAENSKEKLYRKLILVWRRRQANSSRL